MKRNGLYFVDYREMFVLSLDRRCVLPESCKVFECFSYDMYTSGNWVQSLLDFLLSIYPKKKLCFLLRRSPNPANLLRSEGIFDVLFVEGNLVFGEVVEKRVGDIGSAFNKLADYGYWTFLYLSDSGSKKSFEDLTNGLEKVAFCFEIDMDSGLRGFLDFDAANLELDAIMRTLPDLSV